jgi:hypothetical protein
MRRPAVLRRRLAGVARSRAPGHGFERGTDLHVAESKANSSRGFGRWFGRPQQRTSEGAAADLAGVRASVLRLGTQERKGGSGVLTLLGSPEGKRRSPRRRVERDRRRRPKVEDDGGAPGSAARSSGEGGQSWYRERPRVSASRWRERDNREGERVTPPTAWPAMARRRRSIGDDARERG